MAKFKLELDLDQSSGLISKGQHLAKCLSAEVKRNKADDGDNLVLVFEVQTKGQKGRQVFLHQSLKPSVAWRYTTVLAAFGVGTGGASRASVTEKSFVGKLVMLHISHQDWNGEPRAQIDRVLPYVADKDEKTELGAAKGTKLKKAKARVEEDDDDDEDEDAVTDDDDDEDEDAVTDDDDEAEDDAETDDDDEDDDDTSDDDDDDDDEDEATSDDDDDDDDDEEEPAPPPKKAKKRKPEPVDEDDDDDEDEPAPPKRKTKPAAKAEVKPAKKAKRNPEDLAPF